MQAKIAGTSCFAFVFHDTVPYVAFSKKYHAYHMFGGKLDGDESPETCIKRELTEELGLTDFSSLRLIHSPVVVHEGQHYRHHYFVVHTEERVSSRESHLEPISLVVALDKQHYQTGFTTALTGALDVCNVVFN